MSLLKCFLIILTKVFLYFFLTAGGPCSGHSECADASTMTHQQWNFSSQGTRVSSSSAEPQHCWNGRRSGTNDGCCADYDAEYKQYFLVQNNGTDGGGTPEWAKSQGREQQFQGGLHRELYEASMTNKKAPPTGCASHYTAPRNLEYQTTAFESNSLSPE